MSVNISVFTSFMTCYVEPSNLKGVTLQELLLLYNDYSRRGSFDASLTPIVFNPLVELFCSLSEFSYIKETKNRVAKIKGIGLSSSALELCSILSNGIPGSKEYESRSKELFKEIIKSK